MTCCLFKDALALVSNVKAPHVHYRKPTRHGQHMKPNFTVRI